MAGPTHEQAIRFPPVAQISATSCCEKVADEVRAILEGESAD